MQKFTVQYYAGPYSGKRVVHAEDDEEAKEKVRRMVRKEMTLPMYTDGYKVIDQEDIEEDE